MSDEHKTRTPQKTCDDCGTVVSTTGYLGGGIVCSDCAKKRREEYE